MTSTNFGINVQQPSSETFLVKHFVRMQKAAAMKQTDVVMIMLEQDKPLSVCMDMPPWGGLQCYLAPMIVPEMD